MNTFFNVTVVFPNTGKSERFSYNGVVLGQRKLAQGIVRGFEQQGALTSCLPARLKRYPSISIWSAERSKTAAQKFSVGGERLGQIMAEAGIKGAC